MVITHHSFIDSFEYSEEDRYMILGTIHPHDVSSFKIPFFYGNKGSLWEILSEAFPSLNFSSAQSIINELKSHRVFITDTIRECYRENEKSTSDDSLTVIEDNRKQIESALKNSNIHTIFFTSGFGKNNAAGMFIRMFNIKAPEQKEFIINENYFGKRMGA